MAAMLLLSAGLAGCTTTEGTNAFADPATFEREVMTSTAQGLGLVPQEVKPDPTTPRGPLVMPKSTRALPAPRDDATELAMLPEDSDKVKVSADGITQDDLRRLREARVVDLKTPGGRPLTAEETRKLTVRLKATQQSQKRSIFLPPEQYYTTAAAPKQDLVCLAKSGDLVAVNDPTCPIAIRKALLKKG